MREVVGGLALLAGLGVLLHINLGQRDRRFKTGYKNNQVPTQMAMGPRLKWTAGLWIVGGLCLADSGVLAFLAAAAGAIAGGFTTWKLYPQFWSRFQRGATSNAAFITARLSMSTAIGGSVAYVIAQGLGGGMPSVATTPQVSSPAAASAKSVSRSPPTAPAPVEEIIQTSRSTVAPTVMPVEVKGALSSGAQGQMPPVRPVEVEAVRAPMPKQGGPSSSRDDADEDGEDDDRSPRDLRALGPIRGLTGARSANAPFDRRFPYTPPAQQRSADPESAYPTAQRDPVTPKQATVVPQRTYPSRPVRPEYPEASPQRFGPQGDGP